MARVFVAAGSNIEPELRLTQAARELRRRFADVRFSACYRNPPLGFEGADFINAVAEFTTSLGVEALLAQLRAIERRCGRGPADPKWAPRAIDLDLLLYDDTVCSTPDYQLPRPDLLRRAYMLGPLAEIAPELAHPTAGARVGQLWRQFAHHEHRLERIALDLNAP